MGRWLIYKLVGRKLLVAGVVGARGNDVTLQTFLHIPSNTVYGFEDGLLTRLLTLKGHVSIYSILIRREICLHDS